MQPALRQTLGEAAILLSGRTARGPTEVSTERDMDDGDMNIMQKVF